MEFLSCTRAKRSFTGNPASLQMLAASEELNSGFRNTAVSTATDSIYQDFFDVTTTRGWAKSQTSTAPSPLPVTVTCSLFSLHVTSNSASFQSRERTTLARCSSHSTRNRVPRPAQKKKNLSKVIFYFDCCSHLNCSR